MTNFQTDYQSLNSAAEDSEAIGDNDVIFHVPPGKLQWHHIDDLDSFFKDCYYFHQKAGLSCIIVAVAFELMQFVFIFVFIVIISNCIDYAAVERQSITNSTRVKVGVSELLIPPGACVASFSSFTWFFIVMGFMFWTCYSLRSVYKICNYNYICKFYTKALKLKSSELQNTPWHEVTMRIQEVQREQQMCIHKQDLTQLDIYHRILRHENYMVAMVNKNIFPVKYNLKFFGEVTYFPPLFVHCLQIILFQTPFSPFKNTWQLREEYKKFANRHALAAELRRGFCISALIALCVCVFAFMFQLLYICVNYAGIIRKEPSFLSVRKWSSYAMLRLRLFNELQHEFQARLNRASKPATQYMDSFCSNLFSICIRNVAAMAGVIALFLMLWGTLQPEAIELDGFLAVGAACTCICAMGHQMFKRENTVYVPESLLMRVVGEIHHMPDNWVNKAHTSEVRYEFSQLYQLRITSLIEELLSPFILPLLLLKLRSSALDIVDFFRSFTVEVAGVGDVCSFALMDVSRHGNVEWAGETQTRADHYQQAEHGKTELSLIHFTTTNPNWQSPPASRAFIDQVKQQAQCQARDMTRSLDGQNALLTSLHSLQQSGLQYSAYVGEVASDLLSQRVGRPALHQSMAHSSMVPQNAPVVTSCIHAEGPLHPNPNGLLASILSNAEDDSLHQAQERDPIQYRAAEISFNSLYLHELHRRHLQESTRHTQTGIPVSLTPDVGTVPISEHQPLLDPRSSNSM